MRISDWSSDVCSSDLLPVGQHRDTVADGVERVEVVCDEEDGKAERVAQLRDELVEAGGADRVEAGGRLVEEQKLRVERSEERRGGKEGVRTCRYRWSRYN